MEAQFIKFSETNYIIRDTVHNLGQLFYHEEYGWYFECGQVGLSADNLIEIAEFMRTL
jgi:hypothetical protein